MKNRLSKKGYIFVLHCFIIAPLWAADKKADIQSTYELSVEDNTFIKGARFLLYFHGTKKPQAYDIFAGKSRVVERNDCLDKIVLENMSTASQGEKFNSIELLVSANAGGYISCEQGVEKNLIIKAKALENRVIIQLSIKNTPEHKFKMSASGKYVSSRPKRDKQDSKKSNQYRYKLVLKQPKKATSIIIGPGEQVVGSGTFVLHFKDKTSVHRKVTMYTTPQVVESDKCLQAAEYKSSHTSAYIKIPKTTPCEKLHNLTLEGKTYGTDAYLTITSKDDPSLVYKDSAIYDSDI